MTFDTLRPLKMGLDYELWIYKNRTFRKKNFVIRYFWWDHRFHFSFSLFHLYVYLDREKYYFYIERKITNDTFWPTQKGVRIIITHRFQIFRQIVHYVTNEFAVYRNYLFKSKSYETVKIEKKNIFLEIFIFISLKSKVRLD